LFGARRFSEDIAGRRRRKGAVTAHYRIQVVVVAFIVLVLVIEVEYSLNKISDRAKPNHNSIEHG